MAVILQIETATSNCSVAIAKDGRSLGIVERMEPNIHAGSLTLFIEQLMREQHLTFQDLDAVAVSKGPGSYTGLRIGVSIAKGICFATGKPLIAPGTLEIMAYGFLNENPGYKGLVCPMIDARRMEVYTALFDHNLKMLKAVEAKILAPGSYDSDLFTQEITFIGDGSVKCIDLIRSVNAKFSNKNFNSARYMERLSAQLFENGKIEDLAYFEPFYLKDFVFSQSKKLF